MARIGNQMIIRRIRSFIGNDSGVTGVEYALLSVVIAVLIISQVGLTGDALQSMIQGPAAASMNQVAYSDGSGSGGGGSEGGSGNEGGGTGNANNGNGGGNNGGGNGGGNNGNGNGNGNN